jgi:hypothetical protein
MAIIGPDGEAVHSSGSLRVAPTFQFDGRTFGVPHDMEVVTILDLAYRARRGDFGAITLLTAIRAEITDNAGQPYWPMG